MPEHKLGTMFNSMRANLSKPSSTKNRYLTKFMPWIVSTCTALFVFRDYFFYENLPGDLGDGRAYVVYVSHWYEFLLGKVELRDTSFFWPAQNTLGSTDPLLAQGLLSVPLRLLGFSMVTTATLVTIFLSQLGFYACFKVLEVITKSIPLAAVGTFLVGFSYNFNAQLGHPQIVAGYPLLFIVLYHGYSFWNARLEKENTIHFQLMLTWTLLLSLTSWYALISAIIASSVVAAVTIFLSGINPFHELRLKLHRAISGYGGTKSHILTLSSFALIGLWIYIYVPYIREGMTGWNWGEVAFYGPRWGDIINTSVGASGFQERLHNFLQLSINPTFERAMGVPLLLIIAIISFSLLCLREDFGILRASKVLFVSAWILTILTTFDERGQSAWWIAWKYFPGASSLRAVGRVRIVIVWIFILAIILCISHLLKRISKAQTISISFFLLLLMLEPIRNSQSYWKMEEFLPKGSEIAIAKLIENDCSAFLIIPRNENQFDVLAQYDAMAISAFSGIPTINGSSGKTPEGWNFYDWDTRLTDDYLDNWLSRNESQKINLVCKIPSFRNT